MLLPTTTTTAAAAATATANATTTTEDRGLQPKNKKKKEQYVVLVLARHIVSAGYCYASHGRHTSIKAHNTRSSTAAVVLCTHSQLISPVC